MISRKPSAKILIAILAHSSNEVIAKIVTYWNEMFPESDVMIVYGGTNENFEKVDYSAKRMVTDSRLRTQNHQRECQSYTGVFDQILTEVKKADYDFVYFTEFDHLPLRKDMFELLINQLGDNDVQFHVLQQIDRTNNPHYLYHLAKSNFKQFFSQLSKRNDGAIFSAYGFGQLWRVEPLIEFASIEDSVGCYLELWMPTLAHHLGYSISSLRGQEKYHSFKGDFTDKIEEFTKDGAWSVHPVKNFWNK